MHRTSAAVRTDAAAGIERLSRERPEWLSWLRLVTHVEAALEGFQRTSSVTPVAAGQDAPLLHGSTVKLDGGRLKRLIRKLAVEADGSLRRFSPSTHDAVRLASAAVRQDGPELVALAEDAGIERDPLATIAQLAVVPLLHACGRLVEERLPGFWPHGYCPVCAAWPLLAERRGLDRSRRLRCGRCATEWEVQWLRCAYCGERDHRQLGSLVLEGGDETLRVETCETCRGYLKSVATLQRIPPVELLLRDLGTVELDLVALERGFGRPEVGGFALELHLK